ncbi:hypothetical protein FXO38_15668 [Capsicum annuum]|nr:hypothetical protein FXO38_15668 [Capsicum annuum]
MAIESCYYLAFSTLVGLFFLSLFFVSSTKNQVYPKLYPLIGFSLEFIRNRKWIIQWTSEIFDKLLSSTYTLELPLGRNVIFTKDPSNVKHILKTRFNNYHKERIFIEALSDLLRKGLFLSDGSEWKSQRQSFRHDFDPKVFHAFTFVVEEELSSHLIPFLSNAEKTASTIDLQDTFRRFTFYFVCRIGFGFDPKYLLPSLPPTPFADAFKTTVKLSILRYSTLPLIWKAKKFFNTKSEKRLALMVDELHKFLGNIIAKKKERFVAGEDLEDKDVFARIVRRAQGEQLDETFLVNTAVSLVLAGQDTMCSALTWFFWSQELWGSDWADFRPERWLERRRNDTSSGDDWNFIARDPFTYPVFQAGPRTCLGKEIAVVLMKMVVATILKRFRVTPAQDNFSPHYNSIIVSRMKNGFPVRIIERH